MSEPADRRCSVSSISLIEIKTETHRVLQAFLERTISTPHKDRPGRITGAYDDHNKHSSSPQSKRKDGADTQTEKEDDKKTEIKDLMKRSIIRGKGSLGRSSKPKQSHPAETVFTVSVKVIALDSLSPSSSSDEEEVEKMRKQRQVIKRKIASFFKKKLKENKEKEKEQNKKAAAANEPIAHENEFSSVSIMFRETDQLPEFYDEIAQKLEDIIKQSTKIKTPSPKLKRSPVYDNEVVVQQLVKLLSSEGDAMNTKIQQDPELRSKLSRLSYRSFEHVLDIFGRNQVSEDPPLKPSTSPTLQRIAISMEVSRRMVTATGTQRIEGYAERYMDNFIPWVKSHGGWVSGPIQVHLIKME
uniref:BCL2 like 12 n=1 Tax=Poecilia formosa TaxID=48698 RepID=A0A096MCY3_POEFO